MKRIYLTLAAIVLVATTYSCRETTEVKVDDTAEVIHNDADRALDNAGDAIDNAADATADAVEDAGDAIENAADKVEVEVIEATEGN